MTNQEAIKILDNLKPGDYSNPYEKGEAIVMAISALYAQELSKNSPKLDNNFGELISRQAANYKICNACGMIDCDQMDKCKKVFTAQPEKCTETHSCDLISRKMVLALPRNKVRSLRTYEVVEETINVTDIEHLPSAQPEIIRCKDCKWCKDADGLMCKNPASWVVATECDFGCVLAERRTDEADHRKE